MTDSVKASWWQRNWKWFVPVLGLGFFGLVGATVVAVLFLVMGVVKSSDVYQEALSLAQSHPVVQRELGEPIDAGWLVMGSISTSGGSGEADLVIPVSGPEGSARIYAVASRSAGQWHFHVLEVAVDGGTERVGLLK